MTERDAVSMRIPSQFNAGFVTLGGYREYAAVGAVGSVFAVPARLGLIQVQRLTLHVSNI
ncbi:hypothetical protein DRO03_11850 [Methanosarcinales archaeon]|nr:MAG: hypothetical protein DRO03_11850 [Methanosarcinales archaeon]